MRRLRLLLALPLCLSGCGGEQGPKAPQAAPALFHDYGLIPHGKSAEHDFVIDTRALGEDLVPLGVHADCSCARTLMLLRDPQGKERVATGQPFAEFAAQPGELLVVRLMVDTAHKEPADQALGDSRGTVVLQPATNPHPDRRVYVPLRFRFGIDAPVRLRPFAILDFGEVPVSGQPLLVTTIRPDPPERQTRFGPVTCSDPRLSVNLLQRDDHTVLEARFRPGPDAPARPFQILVEVETDLPDGYRIKLAAVGQTVPDLVAKPLNKLSLGAFDFASDHPEQFVLATDHDRSRAPEFTVARFVDRQGRDVSEHFAVRFEPLAGDQRTTRVWVRYTGGLEGPEFRGELVLAKDPSQGPFLPIDVVAFHRSTP